VSDGLGEHALGT